MANTEPGTGMRIATNIYLRHCLKGAAMDTIPNPITKRPLVHIMALRGLRWLALTAQFLLKKDPDLHW